MKSLVMLLSCLTLGASAFETPKKYDMQLFDLPFLIGQWKVINPSPETIPDDFLSISLSLESNYLFDIRIERKDRTIDSWQGEYKADRQDIILGINSETPQHYTYDVNANQLYLNGVAFQKVQPQYLSGFWKSTEVKGQDVVSSLVSNIDLTLYPNFYFSIQSYNAKGRHKYRDGIYYIEDNFIYFVYNDGEQSSQYIIDSNRLVLSSSETDMHITFQRSRLK
ncbi:MULTISPECIES: hypothetical protein [Vibrio]|uniref:hypothetical protein n=1 Tax=Vibrio TaxID=662 RepID=UPI000B5CDE2E|nr:MULTISPECIES: hypothetical protein [Vibrio]HBV76013.1 hypothetical protein [Vibrio sp.]